MAKAATRIKHGEPRGKDEKRRHTTVIEPGDTVPKDVAEKLPAHALAQPAAKAGRTAPRNEDLGTLDAALESIRNRPDNPDRPAAIEGEESFKVTTGGPLGLPADEEPAAEPLKTTRADGTGGVLKDQGESKPSGKK